MNVIFVANFVVCIRWKEMNNKICTRYEEKTRCEATKRWDNVITALLYNRTGPLLDHQYVTNSLTGLHNIFWRKNARVIINPRKITLNYRTAQTHS